MVSAQKKLFLVFCNQCAILWALIWNNNVLVDHSSVAEDNVLKLWYRQVTWFLSLLSCRCREGTQGFMIKNMIYICRCTFIKRLLWRSICQICCIKATFPCVKSFDVKSYWNGMLAEFFIKFFKTLLLKYHINCIFVRKFYFIFKVLFPMQQCHFI